MNLQTHNVDILVDLNRIIDKRQEEIFYISMQGINAYEY